MKISNFGVMRILKPNPSNIIVGKDIYSIESLGAEIVHSRSRMQTHTCLGRNGASDQLVEYGLLLPLTGRTWQPYTLRVPIVHEYETIASHCSDVSFGDVLRSSGLIDSRQFPAKANSHHTTARQPAQYCPDATNIDHRQPRQIRNLPHQISSLLIAPTKKH
jgi:hypothetical protein